MAVTISGEQREVLYAAARDMPTPEEITRAEDEGRESDAIEMRSRHQHLGVLLNAIGWGEEPLRERIRVAHDWHGGRAIGSGLVVIHRRGHRRLMSLLDGRDGQVEQALEVVGVCGHLLGELTYDPFTGTRAAGVTLTSGTRVDLREQAAVERARRGISTIDDLYFLDAPESQRLSEEALRALAMRPVVAGVTAHFRRALQRVLFTESDHAAGVRTCTAAGDVRGARVLRERFEDAARLLDDLGWGRHDPCTRFDVTVPHPQLARTLLRLHIDASDEVDALAEGGDSVEEVRDALRVTGVAMELLARIVSQHHDVYDAEAATR